MPGKDEGFQEAEQIMGKFNLINRAQQLMGYAYPLSYVMQFMEKAKQKLKPEELVKMGQFFDEQANMQLARIDSLKNEIKIMDKVYELEELELKQTVLLGKPELDRLDAYERRLQSGEEFDKLNPDELKDYQNLKKRLEQSKGDVFDEKKAVRLKELRGEVPMHHLDRIDKNKEYFKNLDSAGQTERLKKVQEIRASFEKSIKNLDNLKDELGKVKKFIFDNVENKQKAEAYKKTGVQKGQTLFDTTYEKQMALSIKEIEANENSQKDLEKFVNEQGYELKLDENGNLTEIEAQIKQEDIDRAAQEKADREARENADKEERKRKWEEEKKKQEEKEKQERNREDGQNEDKNAPESNPIEKQDFEYEISQERLDQYELQRELENNIPGMGDVERDGHIKALSELQEQKAKSDKMVNDFLKGKKVSVRFEATEQDHMIEQLRETERQAKKFKERFLVDGKSTITWREGSRFEQNGEFEKFLEKFTGTVRKTGGTGPMGIVKLVQ